MIEAIEIFEKLCKLDLLKNKPLWWWENAGSFEVCVGAILVQNAKWENVQKSIKSMKNARILSNLNEQNCQNAELNFQSVKNVADSELSILASHIFGLQNTKAAYLRNLAKNILRDFEHFESFTESVSRDWLLEQKGFGFESADCVLNYLCKKEVMVVDRYTFKMLCAFGVEMPDYADLQSFFENGICENFERALRACKADLQSLDSENFRISESEISLSLIFARFHAMIVELNRRKIKLDSVLRF